MRMFDWKLMIPLASVDMKLVMRTAGLRYVLPVMVVVMGAVVWRFGDRWLSPYVAGMVLTLSLVFGTQFTRTDGEMTGYAVLPLLNSTIVLAKNLSSLCCVAGPALVVVVLLSQFPGIEPGAVVRAAAIVVFMSLVLLASGNALSVRALARKRGHVSPETYFPQMVLAVVAFVFFVVLEGERGVREAAIICSAIALAAYLATLPGTCRALARARGRIMEV